ncbi:MAG: DUF2092 domain-containing protein [Bradyrhizobium sp.]|uniref:DUF2092 domain-containing protein n=1 Tax=Bradyrhizobium sp. TaxID=376 RepID=UPI0025C10E1F|nr:DUF2092 domain-containing protein [Bradyrhizobium sp.]MBI5260677.1 DUF2092 domain-containing protein [Bradyrhizobium sp.]
MSWLGKCAMTGGLALSLCATARADDATKILKAMSDFVGGQNTIAVTFDSDIEVITTELQKIQFTSSGQVVLNRPDKMRIRRTGGYADVELVYDGKTVTLFGHNTNLYVQEQTSGSIDRVFDELQGRLGTAMPGTDLLVANSFDTLMTDAVDAKHIGQGMVDGVECEHLAFRTPEVDWQIWVETGARTIPRKYVITSKTVTGAPQYTVRIKEWKSEVPGDASAFAFKAPNEAKKIPVEALRDFDEVPAGVPFVGGKK